MRNAPEIIGRESVQVVTGMNNPRGEKRFFFDCFTAFKKRSLTQVHDILNVIRAHRRAAFVKAANVDLCCITIYVKTPFHAISDAGCFDDDIFICYAGRYPDQDIHACFKIIGEIFRRRPDKC